MTFLSDSFWCLIKLSLLLVFAIVSANAANAEDVHSTLRSQIGLPYRSTVIWPPRQGLVPGDIIDPQLRVIEHSTIDSPAQVDGKPEINIPLSAADLNPIEAFWTWRNILVAPQALNISLSIRNLKIQSSLPTSNTELAEASSRSAPLMVVSHSYIADAFLKLSPKTDTAKADWVQMRRAVLADQSGTAHLEPNGGSISLRFPKRITLAIETEVLGHVTNKSQGPGPLINPKLWALATIASGRYDYAVALNQDWNVQSANVLAESLSEWKPLFVSTLTAAGDHGLRNTDVASFLRQFARRAQREKIQLLVIYYVGHMERLGTGGLALLMGDAPAKLPDEPVVTNEGSGNLRDLAQIIDQAQATLAPPAGTIDAAVIHRSVAMAKIPFVLLIDGCLTDPSYADARTRLGIVVDSRGGEPVYIGPDDAGTALRKQVELLQSYSVDFPWLKSKNPTILGATPGTAAYADDNPIWALGAKIGPIAAKIAGTINRTRWNSDRLSLIRILDLAADRSEIGPQELTGTVSWSDWLPLLRRFDPNSFKN
jgi:hypothetical protein